MFDDVGTPMASPALRLASLALLRSLEADSAPLRRASSDGARGADAGALLPTLETDGLCKSEQVPEDVRTELLQNVSKIDAVGPLAVSEGVLELADGTLGGLARGTGLADEAVAGSHRSASAGSAHVERSPPPCRTPAGSAEPAPAGRSKASSFEGGLP